MSTVYGVRGDSMSGKNQALTMPHTKYYSLSDNSLRSMYSEIEWGKLGESDKLELLQETVNREISDNAGKYTCFVSFENMSSNISGYQSGSKMALNREMFVEGKISCRFGETTIKMDLDSPNYLAYETVLHEYRHILQEKISDGTVKAPDEIKAKFESNNFTVTYIDGQRASQYMLGKGSNSYDLYYLNPTELDAHRFSQEKAMGLVNEHKALYGEDESISSYLKEISHNGYDATLANLKSKYGENVDKEVEQILINKYKNTNAPVDKKTEQMVVREMIASQMAIDNANKKEMNVHMSNSEWLEQHVTKEEYDSTLRKSVNKFYEHELNNPSTSKEEVLSSTSTMAEEYINAVDAFDAAQSQSNSVDSNTSADISNAIDSFESAGTDAGNFYNQQGKPEQAEDYYTKAIEIYEVLAEENPERYNADLAMSYYNYGLFINEKKYFVMALKLAKKQPDNPYCRRIIDALEN